MLKYHSIIHYGHTATAGILAAGDDIIIQEKLDGANASFTYKDNAVHVFSRNNELSEENNLRGCFQFITQHFAAGEQPASRLIYFGEWLVKHKLDYGIHANKFYLYDIYDEANRRYLRFPEVQAEAFRLGLVTVPVFYQSKYQGFDHLMSYVGKTAMGTTIGEGIVVKNVNYTDTHGNQVYVKLVGEGFREIQPQKAPSDPLRNQGYGIEGELLDEYLTPARVHKMLLKLVDEDIIPLAYTLQDMQVIMRNLPARLVEDILQEETSGREYEHKALNKAMGRRMPPIVRRLVSEN